MQRQWEEQLILHCAPTLAGLKSASLFSLRVSNEQQALAAVTCWNASLQSRGVTATVLCMKKQSALIYVYRKNMLSHEWGKLDTAYFLQASGYDPLEPVEENLLRLQKRLQGQNDFPHEIGLFLGYPLEDVVGFVQNKGQNFCLCGCWKVYSDRCRAEQCFARYHKCRAVYLKCYAKGHSLLRLTVAA